tara:strand:+ start:196 stop:636 length:441 start_codon:yes stop_codon:yes gene_type:complete
MTTVISVLTTSKIGIWNIPMRGQNFINNHYANINNYKVSFIYQEGLLFNNFYMLESIIKKNSNNKVVIVFCSNLQLLNLKRSKKEFINFFKKYEIHFALELQKGKGTNFLNNIFKELSEFSRKNNVDVKKINTYQALFKKYKSKII